MTEGIEVGDDITDRHTGLAKRREKRTNPTSCLERLVVG